MKASLPLFGLFLTVSVLSAAPRILSAPERLEVDLAALGRSNPSLQYQNGLRLSAGTAADLNRALLYLNFDESAAPLLKDRRGLYRVLESEYTPTTEARFGDRSAFFRFRRQSIRLRTTQDLWPLQNERSFTISLWLRPMHFFRSSNIFRRVGYASGERKGIEILLEQDQLRLNLDGVLHYDDEVEASRSVLVRRPLLKDQWYHLAVSFDMHQSTLIVFLNGSEEGRFRLDRNGRLPDIDFNGPELAPIQIGGDFIGQIDELMILDRALSGESDLDTTPYGKLSYNHNSGRGTLPMAKAETGVYQIAATAESVDLKAKGQAANGSSLRLYYRTSARPFRENDRTIPYRQFGEMSRRGEFEERLPSSGGQYVQLKVEWQPDPSGHTGPVLTSLAIEQNLVSPPIRPSDVRVIDELSRDGKICLEWRINPEMEVEETGGYAIHVGVRPNEYEAVLRQVYATEKGHSLVVLRRRNLPEFPLTAEEKRQEQLRPERIREWKRSHVRVFVDNDLLSEARFRDNVRRPLPFFEHNHPYYFAVSAFIHAGAPSTLSQPARIVYTDE